MNKKHANFLIALTASLIVGCASVGGAIYGAGVGYILGDAEMGAAIGATAGLVKDIWD
jgi:uncharacterized membrane protein